MANISGNPVWKDYPDTTTLIDAEALNNLETGLNNAATTAEWAKITGVPTAFTPTAHAASHGEGGSDPITPESIGAVPDDDPRLYDSGWRDISAWLLNGWAPVMSGRCRAIRQGRTVHFQAYLEGTNATSDTIMQFPQGSGFSGYDAVLTWQQWSATASGAAEIQRGTREVNATGVPRARIFISGSWGSDDAPPTTPPGTPA